MNPQYLELHASGELRSRAEAAVSALEHCEVCPWRCGVDRTRGELGFCRTGRNALVSSASPHFGEEDELVGKRGSGTVFLGRCNLACRYCQNHDISLSGVGGREAGPGQLAEIMLGLQKQGCHNVNFVSPSHVVPQILEALCLAVEEGFNLPLVYNSGGYDALGTLKLLDGVIDIYLPDMKYADAAVAQRLSLCSDYPRLNRLAVKEMHRQVGGLELDSAGVAQRGLLIRHLVLPGGLAGTEATARFIAAELSPRTRVNLMRQYYPAHHAWRLPPLDRPLSFAEYRQAVGEARAAGLTNLIVEGGAE